MRWNNNKCLEQSKELLYNKSKWTHTTLHALRWLQVQELRNKYPNDADFGHEVAKLIKKDE